MSEYDLSVYERYAARLDAPAVRVSDFEVGQLISQHLKLTAEVRRLRAAQPKPEDTPMPPLSIYDPAKPGKDTGVRSALLDLVEDVTAKVGAGKLSEGEGFALVRRLVNGPLVALVVRATPTPVDDVVLELLRGLFPAA